MQKIILASSSPNRKLLLERLQVPFLCISPDIDESPRPGEGPAALATRLSEEKAQKIAAQYPEAFVIGSDQVCALGSYIINKPETHERAMSEWKRLSGQKVIFYTGISVAHQGQIHTTQVPTELKFKSLPAPAIEAYLKKDNPYQCCAGFKIESLGIVLTEWVKSEDPTALIGLPLIKTVELLEQLGVNFLSTEAKPEAP
jgi:septum formation protein